MKRKIYQEPTTEVVECEQEVELLAGSPYSMSAEGGRDQLTDGTDDLGWGGSSVKASGNSSVWDDDWSEQ